MHVFYHVAKVERSPHVNCTGFPLIVRKLIANLRAHLSDFSSWVRCLHCWDNHLALRLVHLLSCQYWCTEEEG